MSGLSTYTPQTETVEIPGGHLVLRGLCPDDLVVLLRENYESLAMLFNRYIADPDFGQALMSDGAAMQNGEAPMDKAVTDAVLDVLQKAPDLVAQAIALAAEEPGAVQQAKRLPLSVQMEAVEVIVVLTLRAEGGLGKLTERVTRIAGSVGALPAGRSR